MIRPDDAREASIIARHVMPHEILRREAHRNLTTWYAAGEMAPYNLLLTAMREYVQPCTRSADCSCTPCILERT